MRSGAGEDFFVEFATHARKVFVYDKPVIVTEVAVKMEVAVSPDRLTTGKCVIAIFAVVLVFALGE